jgi:hypothetical protein
VGGAARAARSLHAPDAGEPDVDQHDVGAQVDHYIDCVSHPRGLADQVESRADEHSRQGATDQPLVVHQHDGDSPSALDTWIALGWHLRSSSLDTANLTARWSDCQRADGTAGPFGRPPGPFGPHSQTRTDN